MITWDSIQKIQSLFIHLQIGGSDSIQEYDPSDEYRKNRTIGKGLRINQSAGEVYCHTEKFTAWHKKIWEKRKKEIPHTAVLEFLEEEKVWKVGFR
jgi:hypothetical protein